MEDQLHSRLMQLRRRARRVVWLYGLSWLVAVVLAAVFCIGALDWALHKLGGPATLNDRGARLALGLGILLAGAAVVWRLLLVPLRRPLTDLDVALRIERRFPGFNDSLASTVQFLGSGADPRLGSPELQRSVIERTVRQVERAELSDVIDPRPARRVASIALLICLVAGTVAGLNWTNASIAVQRMLFPLASHPWPREVELRLLDDRFQPLETGTGTPFRRVRGDTLRLYVENVKGQPPGDAVMQYRLPDGESSSERLRRVSLRDESGALRELSVATIVVEKGPLEFRAAGGDDHTMDWHVLEVVPPPQIETLQVTLVSPPYAGRSTERLPQGVGHIQALVGTRVEIDAAANTPLASASLRVGSNPGRPLDLSGKNKTALKASFTLEEPGVYSYGFDLKDQTGFENPEAPRYEIRAESDRAPTVNLLKPAENVSATAAAVVPLEIVAEDDLGLKDIRLQYRIERPAAAVRTLPLPAGPDDPKRREIAHQWNLAALALTEGAQLEFWVEASDACDLEPGHTGRSPVRRLTIVSPREKANEIVARQSDLLDELERIARLQRQAHDQTGELQLQLQTAGRLRPREDLNLLKRVEHDQREITARLTAGERSVEARARELLAELDLNRIDAPATRQRVETVAAELAFLRQQHLAKIEQELTDTRKAAETRDAALDGPAGDRALAEQQTAILTSARDSQRIVLDTLAALLAELTEARNRHHLFADLKDLISDQTVLNRHAAEITARTLSKRFVELTGQEKADLARLSERQRRQVDRLDRFAATLDDLARELAESSPAAVPTLNDAAEHIRSRSLAARIREAASQLERNLVGETARRQREILDDLQELERILQERGVSDVDSRARQLADAQAELERLRKQQQDLQRTLGETPSISDSAARRREVERLAAPQQALHANVAGVARRLRRLRAERPNRAVARAGEQMRQAADGLRQGDDESAADHQQQAVDDLLQAERELARARQELEKQLAHEKLDHLFDELRSMIARQRQVIEGTTKLDAEQRRAGNWSRARLMALAELAEQQRGLEQAVAALAQSLDDVEVFALALRQAAAQMKVAADRLADRQTDETTVRAEKSAEQRLTDLAGSLAPQHGPSGAAGGAGDAARADASSQPSGGVDHLAQLRLLKRLQEDLRRRIQELDGRFKSRRPTAEQRAELDRLAVEQRELADLAAGLPRPARPQAARPPDPLQAAIDGMRAAERRIAAHDAGPETQSLQQQVVADLERLIRLAAEQPPRPDNAPDKTPAEFAGPKEKDKQPANSGITPVKPRTGGHEPQDPKKQAPAESDPHRDQADDSKVRMARRQQLVEQIWGHLPEAVRQELQNVKEEDYLPKYNDLIRDYFESLAE